MTVHKNEAGKLPDLGSYCLYGFYTDKLMAKYPEYKAFRDARLRTKGVNTIYKVVDYVKTPVIDYALYYSVLCLFNKKAAEAIIQGERLRMGFGLGYLEARCVERNFNKPKMNMPATMAARRAGDKDARIYYTDEDYCRISWKKTGNVKNSYGYQFKPTFDFKKAFSAALIGSPLLKYRYPFDEYKDYTQFKKTPEQLEKIKGYLEKRQIRIAKLAA